MNTPTVETALRTTTDALQTHTATARLDAELLIAHVMGHDRSWLTGHPEHPLSIDEQSALDAVVAQRQRGVPLAYLTGVKEFYGRPFMVTPAVLIPRPDSESIIETAVALLRPLTTPSILEIGTGSGCLAITLLAEVPNATAVATDVSAEALEVATHNAAALGVTDRVTFRVQDLLTDETNHYDLLVTNLPYVPTHWLTNESKKRHHLVNEPEVALHGGDDGMQIFTTFFAQCAANPISDHLILEHGDEQSDAVKGLIDQFLPHATCTIIHDLTGRARGWQCTIA